MDSEQLHLKNLLTKLVGIWSGLIMFCTIHMLNTDICIIVVPFPYFHKN